MRLPRLIRQFKRNLRDYGLIITLRKSLVHMIGGIYRTCVYRICRMDLRHWEAKTLADDGLEYRLIGPEEHELIRQIEELDDWLEGLLERRLRLGALCLIAQDGCKVAGFSLVSFGRVRISLIRVERTFKGRSAWGEQITVRPEYRRCGVGTALRYRVFAELKARGIARFYGGTLRLNTPSLRLARKVGLQEIIDVHYRKILRFEARHYTRLLGSRVAMPVKKKIQSGAVAK